MTCRLVKSLERAIVSRLCNGEIYSDLSGQSEALVEMLKTEIRNEKQIKSLGLNIVTLGLGILL